MRCQPPSIAVIMLTCREMSQPTELNRAAMVERHMRRIHGRFFFSELAKSSEHHTFQSQFK